MPAPRATEAAIRHALTAWIAVYGAKPGQIEIMPDGTIRLYESVDTKPEPDQPAKPKKWAGAK